MIRAALTIIAALALALAGAVLWGTVERSGRLSALARVDAIHHASVAAREAQEAINHEPARKSAAIAEKSDAETPAYLGDVRRAADAYRVRPEAHCASPANLPGDDPASPVDDRSRPTPGMVAVSRADFDLLTGNSGRLAKVQQDAAALIAAGVAMPANDGAQP